MTNRYPASSVVARLSPSSVSGAPRTVASNVRACSMTGFVDVGVPLIGGLLEIAEDDEGLVPDFVGGEDATEIVVEAEEDGGVELSASVRSCVRLSFVYHCLFIWFSRRHSFIILLVGSRPWLLTSC